MRRTFISLWDLINYVRKRLFFPNPLVLKFFINNIIYSYKTTLVKVKCHESCRFFHLLIEEYNKYNNLLVVHIIVNIGWRVLLFRNHTCKQSCNPDVHNFKLNSGSKVYIWCWRLTRRETSSKCFHWHFQI